MTISKAVHRPPNRGNSSINILLLWGEAMAYGYASPLWMTFKQALALEAHVRKGEHGAMVVSADRFTVTPRASPSSA